MVIFYINVYIITRDFVLFNPCKIGQATYGARLNSYNADRAPYDAGRASADVIVYRRRSAPVRYVTTQEKFLISSGARAYITFAGDLQVA